jgi:hypothetical protein
MLMLLSYAESFVSISVKLVEEGVSIARIDKIFLCIEVKLGHSLGESQPVSNYTIEMPSTY